MRLHRQTPVGQAMIFLPVRKCQFRVIAEGPIYSPLGLCSQTSGECAKRTPCHRTLFGRQSLGHFRDELLTSFLSTLWSLSRHYHQHVRRRRVQQRAFRSNLLWHMRVRSPPPTNGHFPSSNKWTSHLPCRCNQGRQARMQVKKRLEVMSLLIYFAGRGSELSS